MKVVYLCEACGKRLNKHRQNQQGGGPPPFLIGTRVKITYKDREVEGIVKLASRNRRALLLEFHGCLGGYVDTMPVLWEGLCYRDLIESYSVSMEVSQMNEEQTIRALSGVSPKDEPFVQLEIDQKTLARMTPGEARQHASRVNGAAEAAETDAFLIHFLQSKVGLQLPQAAEILLEFRRWRDARGGSRAPTAKDFGEQLKQLKRSEDSH